MVDVCGSRASVGFTGTVSGRKSVSWEAELILETREWLFDRLIYRREGLQR